MRKLSNFFTRISENESDNIRKVIFCKCKSGCEGNCGCRKSRLLCKQACSECNGVNCSNCSPATVIDKNELEGEEKDTNLSN